MASKSKHSADVDERERSAYHAAGHAIACDELGVYYEKVAVMCEQNACPCRRRPIDYVADGNPEQERHYTLVEAVIDYAGHAAVVALLKHGDMSEWSASQLGAGHDFRKARTRLTEDGVRMVQAKALAVEIVEARSAHVRKLAIALVDCGELSIQQVDLLLVKSASAV